MSHGDAQDGADTSSIRPVSSLRSRFENLNVDSHKPPPSPVIRSSSRLSQHLGTEFAPAPPVRSSLDIQRPTTVHALHPSQPVSKELGFGKNTIPAAVPRPRPQNGFRGPRPVSVGPTSPPVTPALMVQSPQSPPRPAFPSISPAGPTSPPRPNSTGSFERPTTAPIITQVKTGGHGEIISPGGSRKPPPPVNRAAKPILAPSPVQSSANQSLPIQKTPNRPSPIQSLPTQRFPIQPSPTRGTLAPQALKLEDRSVSPFSTPPDSPASSGSPVKNKSPTKGSYFPPPPIHHQVNARRQSRASIIPHNYHPGNSLPAHDTSDDPERRPSLPARGGEDAPPQPPRPVNRSSFVPPPDRSRKIVDPPPLHLPSPRRPPESSKPPIPEPRRVTSRGEPPPRPSEESKANRRSSILPQTPSTPAFLPPPKRVVGVNGSHAQSARAPATTFGELVPAPSPSSARRDLSPRQQIRRVETDDSEMSDALPDKGTADYPDATQANRRQPRSKVGLDKIWTHYDTRLMDICGKNVCTSGYITRAWDVTTGKMFMDLTREEREVKVLSMVFKPGASAEDEGQQVWTGDNYGEIQEVDLQYRQVVNYRPGAHGRHDVVKMHRFQNTIWSIDSDGRLLVWLPDSKGVPNLDINPNSHRVAKGHTFSIIARDLLWYASGKEIRIYDPASGHERSFHVTPNQQALVQPSAGEITSGATLPTQLDRVYFGHSDGKVSIYSTESYRCVSVVNVSNYKITTMAGVGPHIWAGFSTGYMYVYDMKAKPWKAKKEWRAHDNPVASIVVDRSSVWRFGQLQVASIGLDNAIRLWDGMLEDDFVDDEMRQKDVDYCDFREIKTVVVTWNAGASTPMDIRHDQKDENFFREVIQPDDPPDILVFGFQELVDLEDKGLTAKNLFKGRHKSKANQDPEQMGRQYRAWRDFLQQNLEQNMPRGEEYSLVQTGNLVGLFSCIFIKSTQRGRIQDMNVAEVKRGMGGLYGNKGAILIRFVLDDTSVCFVNCHLAAGQKETLSRNNDATAILEATALEQIRDPRARLDSYVLGGDGTMIMDHEIAVINGDLNYRIDTMGRDSVVKTIQAGNLERLLDRDQLLLSRRRNPAFRLRNFKEDKITFAPTYKYDVRTDRYDSSEKNRSPAWCDRILYRGQGRVKMIEYRRHECWASDHRPVSGTFLMRIKSIVPDLREHVWDQVQEKAVAMKMEIAETIRLDYLVNVLGVSPSEAKNLATT